MHASPDMTVAGGRVVDRMDRALHSVEKVLALASAAVIFLLMMIGVVQILSRKLFNWPIYGYIDMVEISVTVFAFLAISYCERMNGHVRMELFVGKLKGRPLWLAEVAGQIVGLFVIGILIWFGWEHALRAYVNGDSTIDAQYPWWPSKMLVPIAFTFLWLRLFVNLIGYARLVAVPDATPIAVPLIADVAHLAEEEAAEAGVLPGQDESGRKGKGSRP